jgi:lipid-A-disaccharide synthase
MSAHRMRRARLEVARELAGVAWQALTLPAQLFEHSFLRDGRRAALAGDLRLPPASPPQAPTLAAPAAALRARPLELVLSCAEASGEIHARLWLAALRTELARIGAPPPRVRVLGSPSFDALDCERIDDPVANAAMGLSGVAGQAPYYLGLATRFAAELRARPADLFLPVDSPALHVPLARLARRAGARVVHLVAPQYWGWAPWRAARYRAAVDHCLCLFAFEPAWFQRAGIRATWVGHPLWDALPRVEPCPVEPLGRPPRLARVAALRARVPDLRVSLFQERPERRELVQGLLAASGCGVWAELATQPLHEGLATCRAAFSVSGTVLLDLLHQQLPAVVIYRLAHAHEQRLRPLLLDAPFIALPNLLAHRALLPEHVFAGDGPAQQVEDELHQLLVEREPRARVRDGLEFAARRLGPPGAAERAARWTLAELAVSR